MLLLLVGCGGEWAAVDADGDGLSWLEGDCDDADPAIGPHAEEIWYDGVDQNCDGWDDFDADMDGFISEDYGGTDCHDDYNQAFPGWVEIWYDCYDNDCAGNDGDQDGDGFVPTWYTEQCPRWTELNPGLRLGDCWDDPDEPYDADYVGEERDRPTPAQVNPDARDVWYDGVDVDCDGASDFDADGDGWDLDEECDDTDPDIFPDDSVPQIFYNCVDESCSGNDGDQDLDGYVDEAYADGCADWAGINPGLSRGDCDDADASVHPGASDAPVDGVDQDCDGSDTCYVDADGDGFGGSATTSGDGLNCDRTGRGLADDDDDCDDGDDDAYPGAAELDSATACMRDRDRDGYGDASASGAVRAGADCDDADASTYPGASEQPVDGVDQDCDGDDDCYLDADGDGYGVDSVVAGSGLDCDQPGAGLADDTDDCDDSEVSVNPGGDETLDCFDGLDQDCDGLYEDGCYSGGELVITELFYVDGGDDAWFELTNVSGGALDLYGLEVDNLYFGYPWDDFTINASIPMADGDRVVLCKDASRGHTAAICDFEYGGLASSFDLDDGDRYAIEVRDFQGGLIDELDYETGGAWPQLSSAQENSIELCEDPPTASGNDDGASWSEVDMSASGALYYSTGGDYYGTPGALNTCN
ncbi:MAG: hypothetical protein H6741_33520 [Alphaproteobacteria bacterium]|nr:hypothetical protein [Alphaproteobacteria bacterium]